MKRYEILEELGRGGMGVVYKVRDTKLDRIVALKGLSATSELDFARFEREARLAAKLAHPNIVAVHDIELSGEDCFITMEYVEGVHLGIAKLPIRGACVAVLQVADALAFAHENGVLHRDVKPENILVDTNGVARLADFGLARPVDGPKVTVSGAILGTPAYMPPEQARGLAIDERTDVYSLGASLYHALCGRPPFDGQDVIEVLSRVVNDLPEPLRKRNPAVSADLDTIVMKCLEKEPADRYATADAFAADLKRHLAGEPIHARPPGLGRRIVRRLAKRKALVSTVAAALLIAGFLLGREWLDTRARAEAMNHLAAGEERVAHLRMKLQTKFLKKDLKPLAEKAVEKFEAALKAYPNLPEAWIGIGRAWAHAGETDLALASFNKAAEAAPESATPLLERLRLTIGEYESHRHEYADVRGSVDTKAMRVGIEADVARIEKFTNEDAERLFGRAILAFADGEYEDAERLLGSYLEVAPADELAHLWRGHALVHLERYEEALPALFQSIRLNRGHSGAFSNRARAHAALGRFQEALEDYEAVLGIAGPDAVTYYNRAIVHIDMGQFEKAVEDADRALELNPDYAPAWLIRGNAWSRLRRHEKSAEDYKRVLELDPGNVDAQSGIHFAEAMRHSSRKDHRSAIRSYDEAIRLRPDWGQAWNNRGLEYWRLGERDPAVRDFTKAVELKPFLPQPWANRGDVRSEKGDVQGAVSDWSKSLELRPGHGMTLYKRAFARNQLRDYTGAVADYTAALRAMPNWGRLY